MSDLIYNISKEAASQLLGISTRTIDRYLAQGKLTSKKTGNKVMLAQDEVILFKKDDDDIEINDIDVISWSEYHSSYGPGTNSMTLAPSGEQLGKLIDEKFDRFTSMLENKDQLLEEKNTMIFWLQKKIGEMETKIQAMIALPEHHNEKEQLLTQKKELQNRLENLNSSLKKEEMKNNIFIWLLVIVWLIIMMLMFWNPISTSKSKSVWGNTDTTINGKTQAIEEVP